MTASVARSGPTFDAGCLPNPTPTLLSTCPLLLPLIHPTSHTPSNFMFAPGPGPMPGRSQSRLLLSSAIRQPPTDEPTLALCHFQQAPFAQLTQSSLTPTQPTNYTSHLTCRVKRLINSPLHSSSAPIPIHNPRSERHPRCAWSSLIFHSCVSCRPSARPANTCRSLADGFGLFGLDNAAIL